MHKLLSVLVVILLLGAEVSYAQGSISPENISQNVSFVVSPKFPGPNQTVTVSIESSAIDINSAFITWRANGSELSSGKGAKRVEFQTGGLGSETNVSVSISTEDTAFTRSLILRVGDVDLLWQGNTYVPPFYKGRGLWSYQSRITILAIPHVFRGGEEISSRSLIYRWSQNGTVLGSVSGTGKNSLSFVDTILSLPQEITVDVLTDQDTVVGRGVLKIESQAPKTLVYEDNPLLGLMLHKEVGSDFTLKEKEASFAAMPLFFSTPKRSSSHLDYTWTTNSGSAQKTPRITLRAPENLGGKARVNVSVKNTVNTLQTASKAFLVQFGNNNFGF